MCLHKWEHTLTLLRTWIFTETKYLGRPFISVAALFFVTAASYSSLRMCHNSDINKYTFMHTNIHTSTGGLLGVSCWIASYLVILCIWEWTWDPGRELGSEVLTGVAKWLLGGCPVHVTTPLVPYCRKGSASPGEEGTCIYTVRPYYPLL